MIWKCIVLEPRGCCVQDVFFWYKWKVESLKVIFNDSLLLCNPVSDDKSHLQANDQLNIINQPLNEIISLIKTYSNKKNTETIFMFILQEV